MGLQIVIQKDATVLATLLDNSTVNAVVGAEANITVNTGVPGPQGVPGPTGPQGPQGVPGQGVPAGGTEGQVLAKVDGVSYNTEWVTINAETSWGEITGTLSNQTDLQSALDAKQSVSGMSAYLTKAGNLDGLTNLATARDNLNLGDANTPTFFGVDIYGSGSNAAHLGAPFLTLIDQTHGEFVIQPSVGITFPNLTVQTTAWIDSPMDGSTYGRKDGSWAPVEGGAGVYLPLAGGTMTGNIYFDGTSGQYIGKGSFDTSRGGNYGISLVCSVGYEFNWQAGWLTTTVQGASTPRPLYLDSLAGTTLRVWNSSNDLGTEVSHNAITMADGSTDSEVGPWGFGVEQTGSSSHYATVEPQAVTVHDSNGSVVVTPTGITFPDDSVQTTAAVSFTGGYITQQITWENGDVTNAFGNMLVSAYNSLNGLFYNCTGNSISTGDNAGGYIQISNAGVRFPDATVQTTAWTGTPTDYRTLTDYDFTNVAAANILSNGVTFPGTGVNSAINESNVRFDVDQTDGGLNIGFHNTAKLDSSQYGGVYHRIKEYADEGDGPVLKYDYELSLNAEHGLVFKNAGATTIQYQQFGIFFSNGSYQSIAFPGFANVTLTGTPLAPTAATSTNSTQIATTAFVKAQGYLTSAPVSSVAGRTGAITLAVADVSGAAPLSSPTFTGDPKAPTPATSDNDTSIATTAFVKNQGYLTSAPVTSVAGRTGAITLAVADVSGAAPLASPSLTGTPLAPTATTGDSSTQIATTAFVQGAIIAGSAHAETLQATVRNNTGATLNPFTVVYINGALGNNATVAKAQANSEATSSGTFAVTQAAISNNADGIVISAGVLSNVDTSAYTDGDKLYLSPTVAGGVTTTKPSAPNHLVYVGVVTRSHPTLGTVSVRIQNGETLDELHDVAISSKTNLDLLSYESSTDLWKNKSFSTLGLLTSSAAASAYYPLTGNPSGFLTSAPVTSVAGRTGAITLSVADVSGAAATGAANTFSGTNTFSGGSLNLGTSAAASTINVGTGASTSGITKAVNVGTNGVAGSTTNITVGSTTGTSTTTLQGTTNAPTPSVNTNTTQIATTSFVRDMLMDPTYSVPPIASTTTVTSGTGAAYVNASPDYGYLVGPNANLAGFCQKNFQMFARSSSTYGFNFTKNIKVSCKIAANWSGTFTAITQTLFFRLNTGTTNGTLTQIGFGISINLATKVLSILAHDGTTLTTKVTSWTVPFSGISSVDFMVESNGAGTVFAYADGVLIDSTTGMSTATTSYGTTQALAAVEINSAGGTSTANPTSYVSNLRSFVAHG